MQKPKKPVDLRPGRAAQQLMLRLPEALRERIKVAADNNGRSLNAEIVATLVEQYPEPNGAFETAVQALLDVLTTSTKRNEAEQGAATPVPGRDLTRLLDDLRAEIEKRVSLHT